MRTLSKTASIAIGLGMTLVAAPGALAVEPGIDIAVPRVAITNAGTGGTLTFSPASIRIEPGDHVRWRWVAGFHNTTSGSSCVASGLWNNALTSSVTSFTRQFSGAPGSFPYYCAPHCTVMTGTVLVTTPIQLTVTDLAPMAVLSWNGGGGLYRIFRADNPLFNAATVLTPPGGAGGGSFNDTTGELPAEGTAFFYLVMNQF